MKKNVFALLSASCNRQSFGLSVRKFSKDQNIQGIPREILLAVKDRAVAYLHVKPESIDTTTSLKVTFNGFVSAVGGGLGLFLGFSLLSALTTARYFILRILNSH